MLSRVSLREGGLPRLVEGTAIEEGVDEDDMMAAAVLRQRQQLEGEAGATGFCVVGAAAARGRAAMAVAVLGF
jgi:hypothetical protein